jgi:hypothetical protein
MLNKPTPEVGLLNQSSCLDSAKVVTKFITALTLILVTLCFADVQQTRHFISSKAN